MAHRMLLETSTRMATPAVLAQSAHALLAILLLRALCWHRLLNAGAGFRNLSGRVCAAAAHRQLVESPINVLAEFQARGTAHRAGFSM